MVSFKLIKEADIDVICELGVETFKQTYSTILSAEQLIFMLDLVYSYENVKAQIQEKGYDFYVAYTEANVACGFVAIEKMGANKFCLQRLYALNDYKGRGIGREMLEFVENYVRENGETHNELILYVNKKNKTLDFYKYVGFSIINDVDFEIGNGFYRNDYIMQKEISR